MAIRPSHLALASIVAGCGDETTPAGESSSSESSDASSSLATSSEVSSETIADTSSDGSSSDDGSSGSSETAGFACGDGQLDPGELCDDGNDVEDDACSSLCLPPVCGDGIVQRALGESCDDGNDDDFDACPTDCLATACGDGVREGLEECDHGTDNGNGYSTCTAACVLNTCGDGYLAVGVEACDEGAATGDGVSTCSPECQPNVCGDGYFLAALEQCDDGDENGQGLCSGQCTNWLLAADGFHTCARSPLGTLKCWGANYHGQLGYGDNVYRGDDEILADVPAIDLGGTAVQIDNGQSHSCAVLEGGTLRCWGSNSFGQLGYGDPTLEFTAAGETPAVLGDVDVGGTVVQVACGNDSTCVLLDDGTVRCWGLGGTGTPGYGTGGSESFIGDDEPPSVPEALVDVGGTVVQITAGQTHACALLDTGAIRCWGSYYSGALGYGYYTGTVGDDETPASLGDVPLDQLVLEVHAGNQHTCVRLEDGGVRCFGEGDYAALGSGNNADIGDNETLDLVADVQVGIDAVRLRTGSSRNCVFGAEGNVRCWGYNHVGYGTPATIGDDEVPQDVGDLDTGGVQYVDFRGGIFHSCAITMPGAIRCWGTSPQGQLGYGNVDPNPLAANAPDIAFE